MTYFEQLHPWCIIRLLPNLQRRVVARCRRRNDAESHLQVLRRLMPTVPFVIVFDMTPDNPPQSSQSKGKQEASGSLLASGRIGEGFFQD
ncbi:MAG: hypothetical protein LDL41_24650 [Coleofasciculus sp. S288]|nr:hypothetical protein [Coleofasciculus sp. S288]